MSEYDWLNMTEYDWIWLNMTEYDWIWLNLTEYDHDWMWLNMTEYNSPPHPNLPPDQFKGSSQYPTSGQLA